MTAQASIPSNLESFKKIVAEFLQAAPTASAESLDAGLKCVALAYFGLDVPIESAEHKIAESFLQYAMRRHTEYEVKMVMGDLTSFARSFVA